MGTMKEFITEHGITMTTERTGRNPNLFDSNDMDHWKCTLKRGRRRISLVFSMGRGNGGREPEPEEVLDCLASDYTENTFEEWCGDYGFDPDSRKAERTYRACIQQSKKLCNFLGEQLLEELTYDTEIL